MSLVFHGAKQPAFLLVHQIHQRAAMRGNDFNPIAEAGCDHRYAVQFAQALTREHLFGRADGPLPVNQVDYRVNVRQYRVDLVGDEDDCGTVLGLDMRDTMVGDDIVVPMQEKILGRVVADDDMVTLVAEGQAPAGGIVHLLGSAFKKQRAGDATPY